MDVMSNGGGYRVPRRGLAHALRSPDPLVVLAGPHGSGRSTALRMFDDALRSEGTRLTWVDTLPLDPSSGPVVAIDDVDTQPEEFWDEIRTVLRTRPEVRFRLTCHSPCVVPADLGAVVVTDLRLTPEEIAAQVAASAAPADPYELGDWTRGHAHSVTHLSACGAETTADFQRLLARLRPTVRLDARDLPLAVPHFLTEAVARAVGCSATRLDELERRGLGHWIWTHEHPVFVLLPQVRAATLAQAEETLVATVRPLLPQCVQTLLDEGATYAAFVEAARCGSLALADAAARQGDLLGRGDSKHEIRSLLSTFPPAQLARYPVLAFMLAHTTALTQQAPRRAWENYRVAAVSARAAGPASTTENLLLRAVETAALRISGSHDSGMEAARRIEVLLTELTPEESHLNALETAVRIQCATTFLAHGHLDRAARHFAEAAAGAPSHTLTRAATGGVATIELLRGDTPRARQWLTSVQDSPACDPYGDGQLPRIARALLCIEEMDPRGAHEALDPLWPMAEVLEHWHLIAYARALTLVCEQRSATALEELQELRRRRPVSTASATERLDLTEIRLLVATGNFRGARKLATRGSSALAARIATATVALADGDADNVALALDRLHPQTPRERINVATLQAVLLRRGGQHAEWTRVMDRVKVLLETYDLRSPFLFLPAAERAHLTPLLASVPLALPPTHELPTLTSRELVVLRELMHTSDVRATAAVLHVSPNTVKSQRRSLYRKLNASSREEAVAICLAYGLLDA